MKKEKQILITLLGCLLAVVMICAQLFTYLHSSDSKDSKKQSTKTEQQTPGTEESETIVMASFSLPAPIHVEMNLDPHVLFEIVYEDNEEEQSTIIAPSLAAQKLLTTLFQVIISPNAP